MNKKILSSALKCCICIIAALAVRNAGTYAQAPDVWLKNQFNAYHQQALQEKLYLHTDKSFYLAGEICWFKVYNTDAVFNKPLGISKLAYIEIFDKNNKPVLQTKVALKEGGGDGSVHLPVSIASGKYLLRAYTNWMKNFNSAYFFEKTITVVNARKVYDQNITRTKDSYDIRFFPEGGNLVSGIQSTVAFKVVNQDGRGIDCKGVIINDKLDTVVSCSTLKFGMGSFLFTPEAGQNYKAIVTLPGGGKQEQTLPAAYAKGYVMHLEDAGNKQLKITVQSPVDSYSPPVYLFVHTRGAVKAVMTDLVRNGMTEFLVDIDKLGSGVSHFTLFNEARQPVCERLFFRKPMQHLAINAAADLQLYEARKKVSIKISSADQDGKILPADMSVAVYRTDSLTGPDEMDISNYLWLSADLAGSVESPAYYFNNQTPEAAAALNNLLMTQGWRRFRWEDILQQKKPTFEFVPEYKGHIVKGRVTNTATGLPVKGVECFLSVAGVRTQFRDALSDDSGFVKFDMPDFYGNDEIIVQSTAQDDGTKRIEITSPYAAAPPVTVMPAFALPEKNPATLASQHMALQVQNGFLADKLKLMRLPAIDTSAFYSKPDASYLLDDYVRFTTVEEVLREYVPDVNVRKRDGKFYLPVFDNIRREFFEMDPLILLDGVPVLNTDKIMAYDPLKIKKLEVVARMYFYGNMFFGGIVNFITYNGDLQGYELDAHATVIDYETLQSEREFYSPVYETQDQYNGRLPDYRSLLYWSPTVKTNKDGKHEISFYTSDVTGQFTAVLQGIAADGKTGSTIISFQVKDQGTFAGKK